MSKRIDLVGMKFGRLLVISYDGYKKGDTRWVCECECGNRALVRGNLLKVGKTKSCGCFRKENTSKLRLTHGMGKTKLNYVWLEMKGRCLNTKHKYYHNYGGRGIVVCDSWKESFSNFYNDMIDSYSDGLTLDRINNNDGYYKENCRWTTYSVQANNKRDNVIDLIDGVSLPRLKQCDRMGVKYVTLWCRLQRGISIEEAYKQAKFKRVKGD